MPMSITDDLLYDKRVTARHVAAGRLSADGLKSHIEGLPDLEKTAETFSVEVSHIQLKGTGESAREEQAAQAD